MAESGRRPTVGDASAGVLILWVKLVLSSKQ